MFLAGGPDDDLNVLAKSGEKVHEAFDGKGTGTIAHQGRDVRLLNAENLPGFGLLEAAFFNEAVNLQRQSGFQELLFGVRETEISKDIASAFVCSGGSLCSHSHFSFAFLCEVVRLRPGDDKSGPCPALA